MNESPIVKAHQPCWDPECGSSDGLSVRENGSAYCFVCAKNFKEKLDGDSMEHTRQVDTPDVGRMGSVFPSSLADIAEYSSYPLGTRKVSRDVVDHFNVRMSVDEDGKPEAHYYPYTKKGTVSAYKIRKLPKQFGVAGDFKDVELFGQSTPGVGRKRIIITEGELDALAVAQAMYEKSGKIWGAIVSIPSATGLKNLLDQRDWVNTYSEIVLCFDQDDAGQAAVEKAAKMFPAGKVKVAVLPRKDASDVLVELGADALDRCIFNAQTWSPAGIVVGEQIWEQFQARQNVESVPYPDCLSGLNEKLKGIRHGEITLFTSGTGSGKSTVIKEIVLDLLAKTDDKVGLISLEESVGDTAEKFISMQLQRPIMDPPPISDEEKRAAFDTVFGDERLVLLDHQGSVGDSSLIDKIEYMALMGCKYLVLDHITIAVSEGSEGLSGNEAIDKVMSDLLKITKKHNVWLGLISHLRKSLGSKSFEEGNLASIDDIKGSGSIKQISFDIIAFARNLVAADEAEKNTINFRVLKSRFTGLTGDAGSAYYNKDTARLTATGGFSFET